MLVTVKLQIYIYNKYSFYKQTYVKDILCKT